MNKQDKTLFISAALLIMAAAFTRLFPHPPNFTAIGAMAIFGGSVINNKRLAFVLPLSALFLSDALLPLFTGARGFYGGSQLFVYVAFIIITALACFIRNRSVANIFFAAIWSGAIFFIVSNFGTWISNEVPYPKTLAGLGECYAAAIPFYQHEFFGNFALNAVYGNLFYSALLFGIYAVMERKYVMQKSIA